MKLIAELYQPDVAMLPIGDLFTMSPGSGSCLPIPGREEGHPYALWTSQH